MTHTSKKSPKSSQKTSPKSQNRSKKISHKSLSCFDLASFIKKHGVSYAVRLKNPPYDIEPLKEQIKHVKQEDCRAVNIMPQKHFVKIMPGKKHILLPESILDTLLEKIGWDKEQLTKDRVIYRTTYEENYHCSIKRKAKKAKKNVISEKKAEAISKEITEYAKKALMDASEWAIDTRNTLLEKSTASEKAFVKQLPLSVRKDIVLQYPVRVKKHAYFVDIFYAPTKVAVEIDGGYHREQTQMRKDRERDAALLSVGIRTLRLRNADVLSEEVMKYAIGFMQNRNIIMKNPSRLPLIS